MFIGDNIYLRDKGEGTAVQDDEDVDQATKENQCKLLDLKLANTIASDTSDNRYQQLWVAPTSSSFGFKMQKTDRYPNTNIGVYGAPHQPRFREALVRIVKNSDAVIILCDSSKDSSISSVGDWVNFVRKDCDSGCATILAGNHHFTGNDEEGRAKLHEFTENLREKQQNLGLDDFFVVSTKSEDSIYELVQGMCSSLWEQKQNRKSQSVNTNPGGNLKEKRPCLIC